MKGSARSAHGATWLLLLYVTQLMVAVKNVLTHANDHLSTPHPALSALTRSLRRNRGGSDALGMGRGYR